MPRILLAAALFALCVDAHAGLITAADILTNASPDVTFSVVSPHSGATLQLKSQGGETGVGVSGSRTDGEIDTDEMIVAVFTTAVTINSLRLMLLFDGPEYDDTEEIAEVTAWGPSSSEPVVVSLTATWPEMAGVVGPGSATVPGDLIEGGAALWVWGDPFGGMLVTQLQFTALENTEVFCFNGGTCTNDSDYSIEAIEYTVAPSAIPEPATLGLLGAGLLGVWSARGRRRRPPVRRGRTQEL